MEYTTRPHYREQAQDKASQSGRNEGGHGDEAYMNVITVTTTQGWDSTREDKVLRLGPTSGDFGRGHCPSLGIAIKSVPFEVYRAVGH